MSDGAVPLAETLTGNLSGIGRALVADGTLDQKTAEMLYGKSQASRKSFVAELVDNGRATEPVVLVDAPAIHLRLKFGKA